MQSNERPRRSREDVEAMLDGYRGTALLYVAAKLGIADLLADGPMTCARIAARTGSREPELQRILRGLATMGIVEERGDDGFALGEAGGWLSSQGDASLRDAAILCGEEYMAAWGNLLHTATTGGTAFDHAFGVTPWEHRKASPELNARFNAWLAGSTARVADAIANSWDFGRFRSIADVGGGNGALLAAILRVHPGVSGILVDQPHVLEDAKARMGAAGLDGRWRPQEADFFRNVPPGADLYVLKSVIHDWNDADCATILKNCRKAMGDAGRLLLVERIVPVRAAEDPRTVMVDLHMMAVTGGRERTHEDFGRLFGNAGFALVRDTPTPAGFHLLEGAPA